PNSAEQRNAAAWAAARLANLLVRGIELSVSDRMLVGLVAATGLTRHVLYGFEMYRTAFQSVPSAVGSLPGDLRELIEYTEASVGSVLTVGRRWAAVGAITADGTTWPHGPGGVGWGK